MVVQDIVSGAVIITHSDSTTPIFFKYELHEMDASRAVKLQRVPSLINAILN